MPYEVRKKGSGYVVVNTATGKEHSKKPIPKQRAEAQMRILYGIESGMIPKGRKEK